MILEKIEVGKDTESKMKAILGNLGEQVILYDSCNHWVHGFLLKKNCNDGLYQIYIADRRGEKQLLYNDLKELFLLKADRNFPLPEIDPFPV
jgi:hypothetical protein